MHCHSCGSEQATYNNFAVFDAQEIQIHSDACSEVNQKVISCLDLISRIYVSSLKSFTVSQ